jgi:hypothetical protein
MDIRTRRRAQEDAPSLRMRLELRAAAAASFLLQVDSRRSGRDGTCAPLPVLTARLLLGKPAIVI